MSSYAFIGLGVMGYPMAGHLARAGHKVTVYNRTRAKADAWVAEHGGSAADTPRAAADGADAVMICVGNDDDLRSVTLGEDGAIAGMAKGGLLIDHTTASADVARELAEHCAEASLGFVDAPVSGGQAGAENGQLAIMCGGSDADFARAKEATAPYTRIIDRFGEAGAGQLTKMVNQICIAGVVQGISEGLFFAVEAGLDAKRVAALVSQGAAGSWQLSNRADTMVDNHFDHGFAIDWMRKDLGMALAQAGALGVSLPVTALVDQFYADVQSLGGGRWDTSALIQRLRQMKGQAIK